MNKIIYELKNGNRYVKEYYDNDKLEFEGKYIKWEKNGKVKEYFNDGNLKFEGEYLNGEKNGLCKEYYYGNLKFEGEYLNGETDLKLFLLIFKY